MTSVDSLGSVNFRLPELEKLQNLLFHLKDKLPSPPSKNLTIPQIRCSVSSFVDAIKEFSVLGICSTLCTPSVVINCLQRSGMEIFRGIGMTTGGLIVLAPSILIRGLTCLSPNSKDGDFIRNITSDLKAGGRVGGQTFGALGGVLCAIVGAPIKIIFATPAFLLTFIAMRVHRGKHEADLKSLLKLEVQSISDCLWVVNKLLKANETLKDEVFFEPLKKVCHEFKEHFENIQDLLTSPVSEVSYAFDPSDSYYVELNKVSEYTKLLTEKRARYCDEVKDTHIFSMDQRKLFQEKIQGLTTCYKNFTTMNFSKEQREEFLRLQQQFSEFQKRYEEILKGVEGKEEYKSLSEAERNKLNELNEQLKQFLDIKVGEFLSNEQKIVIEKLINNLEDVKDTNRNIHLSEEQKTKFRQLIHDYESAKDRYKNLSDRYFSPEQRKRKEDVIREWQRSTSSEVSIEECTPPCIFNVDICLIDEMISQIRDVLEEEVVIDSLKKAELDEHLRNDKFFKQFYDKDPSF